MRRSAAPSVRAAKKMKFCTPFLATNREGTTGKSNSTATASLVQQSDQNQVTSDEIRHDTSVNHAVLNENDLKVTKTNTIPTTCANKLLKVEDKLKASTFKGPSHTSLTNKPTPFKCPLQRSSTQNVPSGERCQKRSIKSGKEMVSIGRECNCECNIEGLQRKQKQDTLIQRSPFNSAYDIQSHRISLNLIASRQGILITKGRTASLKDLEGKEIAKGTGYKSSELESLQEGNTLCIGGKEIEVMGCINAEEYLSGKCFQQSEVSSVSKPVSRPPSKQTALHKPFVCNVKRDMTTETRQAVTPRHDVNAPGALVLPRPSTTHQLEHNRGGLDVVDVVVDPHLSQHLRPHQREGVVFLYECVMGLRNFNGNGAILADDMGLGKTLQCISLIWTLHKQGVYGGHPSVKRTLIITPGGLVKNWSSEFRKWLGSERFKVYTVNSDKRVKEFSNSPLYPVMIISYEMFLRSVEEVRNIKFGLIICDEAHRLKNTAIKTATMISGLKTKRRILLTGTPVQNDLKEFHSLIDVCNPGILGTQSSFRRLYEEPIVRGQQPDASSEEKLLGQTRAAELNRLTSLFFLRRTAEVNSRYLPPKVESVVFCRPSLLQLSLYRHLLTSRAVRSCLTSYSFGGSRHLVCIGALKKLCNDPSLICSQCQEAKEMADSLDMDEESSVYEGLDRSFPEDYKSDRFTTDHSGKLQVLSHILAQIHRIGERVVLVSNYTQTLDLLQRLCESRSYEFLRLDGKTPTSKRQSLVDRFNDKHCKIFVFLLSSKAGGVGLNLIGASRLVLFDIDWNPANDIQSMARVWRDGQKKTVHIYRLLTTGTIEEKIYQRQTAKQGLSGTVADAKESVKIEFSREELKDLFTLHENTLCLTHDLLQCTCVTAEVESEEECQSEPAANQQLGRPVTRPCQLGCDSSSNQKNLSIAELMDWQHFPCPSVPGSDFEDDVVTEAGNTVSFVFRTKAFGQETTQQRS